jgi:hypothetical protein
MESAGERMPLRSISGREIPVRERDFRTLSAARSSDRIEKGEAADLMLIHDRFRDQAVRDRNSQGSQGCLDRLSGKVGA